MILAPQAIRNMLPTIISQLVVALKDTALGFMVTYPELLYLAKFYGTQMQYGSPIIPSAIVMGSIYVAAVPAPVLDRGACRRWSKWRIHVERESSEESELHCNMTDLTVSRLLASVTESAPQAIDALAKKYLAAGRPVIAFGAGEPDFDTPVVHHGGRQARGRRPEEPPLQRPVRVCRSCARRSPPTRPNTPGMSSPPPTCRSRTAASRRSTTHCPRSSNPGDEVLLPAPYWTSYPEQVKLAGGVTVPVVTDVRGRVQDDRRRDSRPRAPIAPRCSSSPRRRTRPGRCTTEDEIRAIGEWVTEHGIWVLSDEIYHDFVYDDAALRVDLPLRAARAADHRERARRRPTC